ncbi:hypothetical protein E2542_SST05430 [Spatholobus suberectus]|nr:hypothetical protein E2542_SST05430 [Spatholobus suberectus]
MVRVARINGHEIDVYYEHGIDADPEIIHAITGNVGEVDNGLTETMCEEVNKGPQETTPNACDEPMVANNACDEAVAEVALQQHEAQVNYNEPVGEGGHDQVDVQFNCDQPAEEAVHEHVKEQQHELPTTFRIRFPQTHYGSGNGNMEFMTFMPTPRLPGHQQSKD